ncbi:MAG: ferritin-like domain-containing protein, partial [Gemmatimonadales bacterium]
MKTLAILETLNDPELLDRMGSRRDWLRGAGKASAAAAAASVPLALAATARSAFAQGGLPQQVVDVLNFALTLEYLEAEFYFQGTETRGLIPRSDRDVFAQVRLHEFAHVKFLKGVLGGQAVAKPSFDFSAGGQFDTFANYQTFIALA